MRTAAGMMQKDFGLDRKPATRLEAHIAPVVVSHWEQPSLGSNRLFALPLAGLKRPTAE
jgi:hypothetical protein